MWTEVELIKETKSANAFGDLVTVETRRTVLAEEYSVGMSETYQAMAVGYKPETKLILTNWFDYDGEEAVEYLPFGRTSPVRLSVIRTFRRGEALEMTCGRGIDR